MTWVGIKALKWVRSKGDQPWIFIGRSVAEAEAPILGPPDEKSWLIGKDPDAGKDWEQEEKGTTEEEMVWWHHWLNGHELEQTHGDSEGQGSLVCCSPWGRKGSDTTERLNDNSNNTAGSDHHRDLGGSPFCITVSPVPSLPALCLTCGTGSFQATAQPPCFCIWRL